ncbi:hypothetical protein [Hydrogenispora ethanolica]|uniref:hypothetical protein n=1 Tax=Hydrogenispora ethanolica TaxID=1082276 RepID=UPI001049CBF5|nr:hypothetical protein [Hydrogenispora ethanolica]
MINGERTFVVDEPFIVGTMIGLGADLPKTAIDFLLFHWRFSGYHCWRMLIKVFFSPEWPINLHQWIIGAFLDLVMSGAFGVGLVYFMRLLGPGYFWMKGIAYSLGTWVFVCLIASGHWFGNSLEVYHSFINHQIWGAVAVYWLFSLKRGWLK